MSRIGKKPVAIPAGVNVKVTGQDVSVKGAKSTLNWRAPDSARIRVDDKAKVVVVERTDDQKQSRANHGLARALVSNMIRGVSEGFQKRLQIYGTGYNCKLQGKVLHLNVGFSGRRRGIGSQFEFAVPDGIEVTVERDAARGETEPAQFLIRGADKQRVGQFAAEIRAIRKTEPYKGKGIRYEGEVVRRKQGKAVAGSAG